MGWRFLLMLLNFILTVNEVAGYVRKYSFYTLIMIDFATYDETAESDFGQSFLKQHNLLVLDARDSPAVGEV